MNDEYMYDLHPNQKKQGWWSKNAKWVIPAGCLSSLILIAVFVFGILMMIFGFIKSSDVYQEAVTVATANPNVIQLLGDPVETGWYVSGSLNVSGSGSGTADIAVPLSGTNASATLYVVANKSEGKWYFTKLVVVIDKSEVRINLLSTSGPQ